MAEASSSSFDDWICSLLNDLQSNDADMSDFVQYLLGIVTSDNETDEEKQTAIAELLADLDLKHDHNINNLSEQILNRWYQSKNTVKQQDNSNEIRVETTGKDDAINDAFINAMNQIESNAKNQRLSNTITENDSMKKHKSQILAKYSQVSDEEFDYDDDEEQQQQSTTNGIFQNNNSQDVEDRERKARDQQHEAHKKQQEKNKIDAQNQKQKDEERKKKAQQRAQKQERRR